MPQLFVVRRLNHRIDFLVAMVAQAHKRVSDRDLRTTLCVYCFDIYSGNISLCFDTIIDHITSVPTLLE